MRPNIIPEVVVGIVKQFHAAAIEGLSFDEFMACCAGDMPAPVALVDGLASMGITGFPNVASEPRVRVRGTRAPAARPSGVAPQSHRGKPTITNNPLFDAYALSAHGSMGALADALGVKRTTLAAWAHGRNSCPAVIRQRLHSMSKGAVTLTSWDDAQAAFRRSMRK